LYALAFTAEISDRPKVAVYFKIIVTDPSHVEQIIHWLAVIAIKALEVKNFRLSRQGCDCSSDSRSSVLSRRIDIWKKSKTATAKIFNVVTSGLNRRTKRRHDSDFPDCVFGSREVKSG